LTICQQHPQNAALLVFCLDPGWSLPTLYACGMTVQHTYELGL